MIKMLPLQNLLDFKCICPFFFFFLKKSTWFKTSFISFFFFFNGFLSFSSVTQPEGSKSPWHLSPLLPLTWPSAWGLGCQGKEGEVLEDKELRSQQEVKVIQCFFLALLSFWPHFPHLPCGCIPVFCDSLPQVRELLSLPFWFWYRTMDFSAKVLCLATKRRKQKPNPQCGEFCRAKDPVFLPHTWHRRGSGDKGVLGRGEDKLF